MQYNKLEIFKSAQLQPHGVALDGAGAVPAGADRAPRLRLLHPRRGHREVPVRVPARQVTIYPSTTMKPESSKSLQTSSLISNDT